VGKKKVRDLLFYLYYYFLGLRELKRASLGAAAVLNKRATVTYAIS